MCLLLQETICSFNGVHVVFYKCVVPPQLPLNSLPVQLNTLPSHHLASNNVYLVLIQRLKPSNSKNINWAVDTIRLSPTIVLIAPHTPCYLA